MIRIIKGRKKHYKNKNNFVGQLEGVQNAILMETFGKSLLPFKKLSSQSVEIIKEKKKHYTHKNKLKDRSGFYIVEKVSSNY